MTFLDFLNCMKPVLQGNKIADKVRNLISVLTYLPDKAWGTDKDPSKMYKDSTLAQFGNGTRPISKSFAEKIIQYLDKDNFIQFLSDDDINEDTLNIVTANFREFDSSVNILNIAEKAADIIENILKEKSGVGVANQYSMTVNKNSQIALSSAPYRDRLIIESRGICPNAGCGKPLYISNNDNTKAHCTITLIDPSEQPKYSNLIALCPQCSQIYSLSPSADNINWMKELKKSLSKREQVLETLSPLDLENGIIKVVEKLGTFTELDKIELNYDPKAIKEKIPISDYILLNKITQYVTLYYEYISELLKGYEQEKILNFQIIASQVKIAFLKISDKELSRIEIFSHLVDWFMKSTNGNREECEAIVSYFIQSCEVFYAIT